MDATETGAVSHGILKKIAIELSNFSVGFVKLEEHQTLVDGQLGGSGTLVTAGGKYAILTADHVLEFLPNKGEVGLILPTLFLPRLHRPTIDMALAKKISIARGNIDSDGPDLGLLLLPAPQVDTIGSIKSFYSLSRWRDQVLARPLSIEIGVWFLCGMAHEWTKDMPPEHGYQRVKGFRGACNPVGITTERQGEGFDYLDFEPDHNYEWPQNFEGFSGGGLWQIDFARSQTGDLLPSKIILSGVVFYQSVLKTKGRTITSHGRQSIYGAVMDALLNK